MNSLNIFNILAVVSVAGIFTGPSHATTPPSGIIHDAEHYLLEAQHGEKWSAEDKVLDQKLAALRPAFTPDGSVTA